MEILLWLVPPVVVTVVAMAWVSWLGRAGRGVVGRDEAVARLGAALDAEPRRRRRQPGYAAPRPSADRSSGVAVRAHAPRPAPTPASTAPPPVAPAVTPAVPPAVTPTTGPERFAS